VFPSDDAPVGHGGGQGIAVHGPVHVVLNVLFARPDHLDRPIHPLGNLHGRAHHVGLESAAETAADQMVVHYNFIDRQSRDLGRRGLRPGEHLGAHPHLAPRRRDVHRAVHRFHGGMCEEGQLILRFQQVALSQSLGDVSRGLGDRAFGFACGTELLPDVIGRHRGMRPFVPREIERGQALLGRPHVIADHRDKILEHDHLPYARDFPGLDIVDVPDFAAEHRTGGQGCELQARQHDIDAVQRFAVDLVRCVEALERLADQLEILRVLERRILGRCQTPGTVDQRRVGETAAARVMDDFAFLGAYGGGVHLPYLGSGLNQHGARARSRLAQGQPERPHRIGIAGDLNAECGVRIELVVGRGMFERHTGEVGVELFGQYHGHRGVYALAHLDLRHDERDPAVPVDANECIGCKSRVVGLRAAGHGQVEGDDQAAAHCETGLEKTAPRKRGAGRRVRFPEACAVIVPHA